MPLPAPARQLNIKVLDLCNATCSFCGYNKERLAERIRAGHIPYKLDVDALKGSFADLKAKGIRILHLTGGEPTLHPRFRDLVASAKAAGFQVRTGTNGSILDEDLVKSLKDSGIDYLWYSLDTYPFDKHLEHRGFLALRDKMWRGLALLHRHGVNFFGQTVISRILPDSGGLPDMEGHLDYYRREMGIRRFVFSYPMHRPETAGPAHLATLGGSAVDFTKTELLALFDRLLRLKSRLARDSRKEGKGGSSIVNPYVSILQQMRELEGAQDRIGCHAGRDIFFLGPDQRSLRPCYHHSGKVVDRLDGKPLKPDRGYLGCRDCRDQCFRDPSVAYAAATRPWDFLRQAWEEPRFLGMALRDARDLVMNRGYRL